MSILTGDLPMPTPLVPFVPPPAAEPEPETPAPHSRPASRGRSRDLIQDARFDLFAPLMLESGVAHTTIGSYTACVAALLKRGVPSDASEMVLADQGLSPSSLSLYIRAWRKWHQFLGIETVRDQPEGLAATYLCRHAKPRITLPQFRAATWGQFSAARINDETFYCLCPVSGTMHLWRPGAEVRHHVQVLMRAANGGPFPEDPVELERAVERLHEKPLHA